MGIMKRLSRSKSCDRNVQSLFFNIKKATLPQVCSCDFCEISKNVFFTEHRATASEF